MITVAIVSPFRFQETIQKVITDHDFDCSFRSYTYDSLADIDGIYADCKADAAGGFAPQRAEELAVEFPPELLARVPEDKRAALTGVLAQDPRPHYQSDPARIYGMSFAGMEVRFRVADGVLTVVELA